MSNILSVYYPPVGSHIIDALKQAADMELEYVLFNGTIYRLQYSSGKLVKGIKIGGSNQMPDEVQVVKE